MASKWFRKNQKKLMAVFVVVIMIGFTIGAGLKPLISILFSWGSGPEAGTAFGGEKIYVRGLYELSSEHDLLVRMFNAQSPELNRDDVMRIALLLKEAERGGFAANDDQAKLWLQDYTQERSDATGENRNSSVDPDERLNRLAYRVRADVGAILKAVRHRLSIELSLEAQVNAISVSPQEARHFYKNTRDAASAKTVTFGKDRYLSEVRREAEAGTLTFSQEQYLQQFDKYKNLLPAADGGEGFGYETPARVSIEFLRLNMKRLLSLKDLEALDVTSDEVEAHWRRTRETYAEAVQRPGTTRPEDKQMVVPELSAVRDRVVASLRQEKAYRFARQTMANARAEAVDPSGGPVEYSKVARKLEEPLGALGRLFISGTLPMQTERQLMRLGAGEGQAEGAGPLGRAEDPATGLRFSQCAMLVDPLWEEGAKQKLRGLPSDLLNFPINKDSDTLEAVDVVAPSDAERSEIVSDLYIFRVTDAAKAAVPESLDAVRDAVKADLIAIEAFHRAGREAEQFARMVREVGIDEAVNRANAATRPAGQPATEAAEPASAPASVPATAPDTQPASQPASQPADDVKSELYVLPSFSLTRKSFVGTFSDYIELQSLLRNPDMLPQAQFLPRYRRLLQLYDAQRALAQWAATDMPTPPGELRLPENMPAAMFVNTFPGIRDTKDEKVLDRLFDLAVESGADTKKPILVQREFEGEVYVIVVSEYRPATQADFERDQGEASRNLLRLRRNQAQIQFFSPQGILDRCQWVPSNEPIRETPQGQPMPDVED